MKWLFGIVIGWFALYVVAGVLGILIGNWRRRTPELAAAYEAQIAEERQREARNSRVFGKLYLITDKELNDPQLWLSEEDGAPTSMLSKFGWYQHKRSRWACPNFRV